MKKLPLFIKEKEWIIKKDRSDFNLKKRILRLISAVLPLSIIAGAYLSVPNKIVLTEDSSYSAYPNGFVRLGDGGGIETAAVGESEEICSLFGRIPLKTVTVSVVPEREVIASGEVIGIRIYSDGIMVVGLENKSAARDAGVKKGDIIQKVNGEEVFETEKLKRIIEENERNTLLIKRNGKSEEIELFGSGTEDGFEAGMWVRDSGAGIGTLSFITEDGYCGALGHAICDSDTESVIPLRKGSISACRINSVVKGKSGEPGELVGTLGGSETGTLLDNTENGVYGKLYSETSGIKVPVATSFMVKEGPAEIRCNIDGEGVKTFDINIDRVSKLNPNSNKGMTISVTDTELLEKTGGIVQGMSGSPIVQNGKLVGAVTHVFVNDPTRGYGIFIENMLAEAEKIK